MEGSGRNDQSILGGCRSEVVARSSAGQSPHRRGDESWVEISSQPSSSSLSSIGDEIVTTGLRVSAPLTTRRRRLQQAHQRSRLLHQPLVQPQAGASSQDEYEASASEEDRQLASSTENMKNSATRQSLHESAVITESESDDDEIATALGPGSDDHGFRPLPNAFSNPPAHLSQRSYSTNSSMPPHPHSGFTRPSLPHRSQTRIPRGHPNFMSPSYQADNDAALRASLTTLLSCAAAARGLPKPKEELGTRQSPTTLAGVGSSNQPVELRLVPESELIGDHPATAPMSVPAVQSSPRQRSVTTSSTSNSSTGLPTEGERAKRGEAALGTRVNRASKKRISAAEEPLLSPTLLTWVVSAGVVVLVSVVGFGAGYIIGKEVGREMGRQDILSASVNLNASDATSCGREVLQSSGGSLRRFRWGTSMGRTVVTSN